MTNCNVATCAKIFEQFVSPTSKNSLFLGIEGIEGSGKSGQIASIQEYLNHKGYKTLILREPGGTPFGEGLRQTILQSETEIHPVAEAYLFASSRAQLLHQQILPFLAQNIQGNQENQEKRAVIVDRFLPSSMAYQGIARQLGIQKILEIHNVFPLNTVPHLTFFLNISLQTSWQRQIKRNQKKDYFEKEQEDFYQKIILGYQCCQQIMGKKAAAIDGEQNEQDVFAQIKQHLKRWTEGQQ